MAVRAPLGRHPGLPPTRALKVPFLMLTSAREGLELPGFPTLRVGPAR